jgi:hypothetical protein
MRAPRALLEWSLVGGGPTGGVPTILVEERCRRSIEFQPGREVEVELDTGLHELLHVLVVHGGFATPRESNLLTAILASQVRLAANIGR